VALFAERAKAANSSFELTERNAPEIVRLCRALDGMPLAIELAAARTRVLSVEQISSRLEDSLGLLTGGSRTAEPRQRTLRTAIDWSYELLSEHERALFRRLSVFAGGFALEAAEAVCAGEGIGPEGVLDLLASLIDKSLVTVAQRGGEARYGMLELVRQYALERLEEDAEAEETRCRHAEHYLALAETAEPRLLGRIRDSGTSGCGQSLRTLGRLTHGPWSPVKEKGAHGCGSGSRPRCGASGPRNVSKKARYGCKRRWRGTPEGSPPSGRRPWELSASSSSSSKITNGR
jgi:hypothetical protein